RVRVSVFQCLVRGQRVIRVDLRAPVNITASTDEPMCHLVRDRFRLFIRSLSVEPARTKVNATVAQSDAAHEAEHVTRRSVRLRLVALRFALERYVAEACLNLRQTFAQSIQIRGISRHDLEMAVQLFDDKLFRVLRIANNGVDARDCVVDPTARRVGSGIDPPLPRLGTIAKARKIKSARQRRNADANRAKTADYARDYASRLGAGKRVY